MRSLFQHIDKDQDQDGIGEDAFMHLVTMVKESPYHKGDCTSEPEPCPMCLLELYLAEYSEYHKLHREGEHLFRTFEDWAKREPRLHEIKVSNREYTALNTYLKEKMTTQIKKSIIDPDSFLPAEITLRVGENGVVKVREE